MNYNNTSGKAGSHPRQLWVSQRDSAVRPRQIGSGTVCTWPDCRSRIRSSEMRPGPVRPPPHPDPAPERTRAGKGSSGPGTLPGRLTRARWFCSQPAGCTAGAAAFPGRDRPDPARPRTKRRRRGAPAAGGGPGAQAPLRRDAKRPPDRGPGQPPPGPAEHSPGPGSLLGSGRRLGGGLLGGGPGPGAAPPAAGILGFTAAGGGGSSGGSSSSGSRCGRDGGGRGPAPLPAAPQHPATAGLLPLFGGGQRRAAAARGRRPLCHCGRLLLGAPRLLRARRHQGSERPGRCALLPPARQTSPARLSRAQSPPTPACTSQSASVEKVTAPPQAPPAQPEALPPFSAARAPPGQ